MKINYKEIEWLYNTRILVPKTWKKIKLIDATFDKPKYGANVAASSYDPQLPRYVRITDINCNGTLKNNDLRSISVKEGEDYMLYENDIVFARTGSVGRTYLHNKKNGMCAFASYLIRFRLKQTILDPEFLFQYTHSDEYWRWLMHIHTIGVQPNVNARLYSKMPIIIPQINEQRKIASILSNIDALIESVENLTNSIIKLKNGLMRHLLNQQKQYTKFIKLKYDKKNSLNTRWKLLPLSSVANLRAGGTPSRFNQKYWENGNIPWISSGEVKNNEINISKEKITQLGLENSSAVLFPPGTVLLAITGQGRTRGRVAILNVKATTNQSVIGMICTKKINNKFLFYALLNQYSQLRDISQGSNQAGLNLKIMNNYKILIPSNIPEQRRIASILSNVDAYIMKNQEYKEKLQRLKKSLMQKLFTGQIRVKI